MNWIQDCHLCGELAATHRYWGGVLRPFCRPCESLCEQGKHPKQNLAKK